MIKRIGKATRWLGYCLGIFIILAATAVSIGQLLSPYLNAHRVDLATWVSHFLDVPITINKVSVGWRYGEPELALAHVDILDKKTHKPIFEIQKIKINLKIIQSVLQRKPVPESIKISGVHLTLYQKKTGQLHVQGLDNFVFMDNVTGVSVAGNAMEEWIFSQPNLALHDIEIQFMPEEGQKRSVTLADLELHNANKNHVLEGSVTLNQAMPTQVIINLQWQGDTLDIMHVTSHVSLSLYLEDVSLPQWLNQKTWKNLQIKQGIGSGKFSFTWEQGHLQKAQSQFQLYEMQLQSLVTQKKIIIPRISGHLNWQKDGERQIVTGDDILIDFPQHLWPTTQFSLAFQPDSSGSQSFFPAKIKNYTLHMGYVDLADMNALALASGLLPASMQKLFSDLNPVGEMRSVNIQSDNPAKPENNAYSVEFSDLSFNAWHSLPGVTNLNGAISWDGKKGNLTLDGQHIAMAWNSIFVKPIQLDTASGEIQWKKERMGWWVNAKGIQLSNSDIRIDTDMTLTIPKNDSPFVNVSSRFSMFRIAQIENYLPIKLFDPLFVQWLHHRFQSGQVTMGTVTMQGKLSDFPFDNGKGKFLATVLVKDLEFEYAPGWPALHHLDGKLTLAGYSMTADMDSAEIFNVPLTKVHAYIPYIGPARPQVLSLQALINANLSDGLRFIQESPLRETIGKDLAGIELSGKMNLNLGFTIPVKTPEKTKVVGDAAISSAILQLPDWDIALENIVGHLHFTESTIQTNQLQGKLFDEPMKLSLNTLRPVNASPILKIVLQSKMGLSVLQHWLQISLSPFLDGTFSYTAELNSVPHDSSQPSQLTIRSDLVGVTVHLPDAYAKKANETRHFKLMAQFKKNEPLQTKITYGKLLSAALSYEESNQSWHFKSGEVRLGNNGEANWQSQPGMLITGQVNTLDWKAWRDYFASLPSSQGNESMGFATAARYLRGIDIQAAHVPILGQHLTRARVQVTPQKETWQIGVTSPEMTGQVWLPLTASSVIRAQFRRLYLAEGENEQFIDPQTIPAFSFVGEDVRFHNQPLGYIALDVMHHPGGLRIKKLNMVTKFASLNANGEWLLQKNKYQTHLEGKLIAKNTSQLLNHFGLGSANLIVGEGNMTFNLAWPAAPYELIPATMAGDIALQLGKGRVINLGSSTDAKVGFGRMLNILSLQTLPRRLSLDFSDLFEQGYSFDTMQGHFTLEKGNAVTEDTYFDGSIARIDIKGKIGLSAKDYDLALSVTPYVMGSIPVVATLAGGPIVGAVTWLVEKAASKAVSKVTTYHYSVTGPWDDPVWKQFEKNKS